MRFSRTNYQTDVRHLIQVHKTNSGSLFQAAFFGGGVRRSHLWDQKQKYKWTEWPTLWALGLGLMLLHLTHRNSSTEVWAHHAGRTRIPITEVTNL